MLKISRQVDYALQFIVALSKLAPEEVLSIKAFAKESNISFLFLQKIVRSLRDGTIVEATKGKHGGYRLLKSAQTLSVRDVIEAVDGSTGISQCTREANCEKQGTCTMEQGMKKLHKQMTQYLSTTTVADIA